MYPPTGTLTSFLSCSLSPSLFFPFLDLNFQPEFNFLSLSSSSTLIVPGPTAILSHTHAHKKKAKGHHGRVTTPWYEGNPGEPPQRLLPSGEQPALESEQNQKSTIVHLQDQGHEQILYLTHFPPFHKCLSVPLTLTVAFSSVYMMLV